MSSGEAADAAGSMENFDITLDISAVSRARNSSSDSFGLGPEGMVMSRGGADLDVLGAVSSAAGLPGPDDEGVGSCWGLVAAAVGCEEVAAENWSSTSDQSIHVSIVSSFTACPTMCCLPSRSSKSGSESSSTAMSGGFDALGCVGSAMLRGFK